MSSDLVHWNVGALVFTPDVVAELHLALPLFFQERDLHGFSFSTVVGQEFFAGGV